MEQTKNYKLNKPGQDDFYNVEDFNQNADILDQALKELAEGDSDQYVSKTGDTMTGDLELSNPNTTLKHKLIIGNNDSGYASIYAHDSDGGYSDLMIYAKRFYFPNQILVDNIATPTSDHHAANKKYVDDNAGGKRTCRFVVGTSTAGWTKKDCDYLCDGTDDQVEIQAALDTLPSTGGEVVVLDGTYHITASINMNKRNVTLQGCGENTVLKRMFTNTANTGVIEIYEIYCRVEGFYINGNDYMNLGDVGIHAKQNAILTKNKINTLKVGILLNVSHGSIITDNYVYNCYNGIRLVSANYNLISNNKFSANSGNGIINEAGYLNCITGNLCGGNNNGIYLYNGENNTITGNSCYLNKENGIFLYEKEVVITGNQCSENTKYGIYAYGSSYATDGAIVGNVCNDNVVGGIYANGFVRNAIVGNTVYKQKTYEPNQYSIYINGTNNLIANNMIWGKNYTNSGTGNTFVNNKYN